MRNWHVALHVKLYTRWRILWLNMLISPPSDKDHHHHHHRAASAGYSLSLSFSLFLSLSLSLSLAIRLYQDRRYSLAWRKLAYISKYNNKFYTSFIIIIIIIIALVARISLTHSRHSSLSFIALGRSSGQHHVSSNSCWMYARAGRPAFARPCVGVHKSTSLMSSSLLCSYTTNLNYLSSINFSFGNT